MSKATIPTIHHPYFIIFPWLKSHKHGIILGMVDPILLYQHLKNRRSMPTSNCCQRASRLFTFDETEHLRPSYKGIFHGENNHQTKLGFPCVLTGVLTEFLGFNEPTGVWNWCIPPSYGILTRDNDVFNRQILGGAIFSNKPVFRFFWIKDWATRFLVNSGGVPNIWWGLLTHSGYIWYMGLFRNGGHLIL